HTKVVESPTKVVGGRPLDGDQPSLDREHGQLHPSRHADLVEDVAQVALNGVFADVQSNRDLAVGIGQAHEGDHLQLARGQVVPEHCRRFSLAGGGQAANDLRNVGKLAVVYPVGTVRNSIDTVEEPVDRLL